MIYSEKNVTLKDGRSCVFRTPELSDAAEMVEYLRTACVETEYLARYPEDIRYTEEGEKAYLQTLLDSCDSLLIVCTVDGKMADNCQLVRKDGLKTRHRASVMLALLQEFWGLGIGSAMFSEMELAAKELGISQLELEMIEGNTRAMALYQRMGFTVMAEHPDAIRLKDGSFRKAIFMRKGIG